VGLTRCGWYLFVVLGTFPNNQRSAFSPVNQKQLVVQLLPTQQVVQMVILPFIMNVCVVQDAQVIVARVAR